MIPFILAINKISKGYDDDLQFDLFIFLPFAREANQFLLEGIFLDNLLSFQL